MKLGFARCILPAANLSKMHKVKGIELIGVEQADEALEAVLQ